MDVQDLKIFKTVAEKGNITKAAQVTGYVQSNITSRIKQMEEELQTNLFERHYRGVCLTKEGETLLSYTHKIIDLLDEAIQATKNTPIPKGSLKIGALESTAAVRLPDLLASYSRSYPAVDFTLNTGSTTELIQGVLNNELEGAFVAGPVEHTQILMEPVVEENLVFVTLPSQQDIRSFQHLENTKIMVYRSGCYYREKLEAWLEKEKVKNASIIAFDGLEVIVNCTLAGMGIALIPYSFIQHLEENGKLKSHPIPNKNSLVTTYFIRRKKQYISSALQKFIEMLHIHYQIAPMLHIK